VARKTRPTWQNAVVILSSAVVAALVVGGLYWAKSVLVPLAVAIFFTFLLSPLVTRLQRRVGRVAAVLLVVTLAALLIVGVGWIVTAQFGDLAAELPEHVDNIKGRIHFLRDMGKNSVWDRLGQMADDLAETWAHAGGKAAAPPAAEPVPVAVEKTGASWVGEMSGVLGMLIEAAGGAALAAILVVFMLLKREDLRNRLIWLTGRGNLTLTTKALDEIGQRISRYLLMQFIVNATYGLALAVGAWLIGLEHALLWGFLAAVLRYVPYIGAPVAALLAIILSLAQFPGWTQPLLLTGYIIVLELVSNNVMEPLLYGRSMGVSEVALLVSAGFWTFLWGPIGLVLSGPLTVCLLVVGQYVTRLRFLAVLLGDEPALDPDASLFQRLTAGDQDEAEDIVLAYTREHPPEEVYDGLLVPALMHVRRAQEHDELDAEDQRFIHDATREILDDLADELHDPTKIEVEDAPDIADAIAKAGSFHELRNRVRILGVAARDEWDDLILQMVRHSLSPAKWEMDVLPSSTLASELIPYIVEHQPAVVCLGTLPPGGMAHTRYVCKRLRSRFPDLKILVGRWSPRGGGEQQAETLREAGASAVYTSVREMLAQLNAWLPALQSQQDKGEPSATDAPSAVRS
jgi:predicted PurR-regulated permease PerM